MNLIDKLKNLLQSRGPSHPLAEGADQARALAASTAAEILSYESARDTLLIELSDAEIEKRDRENDAAKRLRDRAAALADRLDAEAAEARGREAENHRIKVRAEAEDLVARNRARVEKLYPVLVKAAREIVTLIAESNTAARQANADLPAGVEPVQPIEATWHAPGEPSQHKPGQPYWLWCEENGRPLDEQNSVKTDSQGGWVDYDYTKRDPVTREPAKLYLKRFEFIDVTTRSLVAARNPRPFASELNIPALYGETQSGWRPVDQYPDDARVVAERLAELDSPLLPRSAPHSSTSRMRVSAYESGYGPLPR